MPLRIVKGRHGGRARRDAGAHRAGAEGEGGICLKTPW
jgi:hypothetical protein